MCLNAYKHIQVKGGFEQVHVYDMWLFEYQVQIQPVYVFCKNLHLFEHDIFMYIEQFVFFPWQFWTRKGDIIVFKWL